MDSDEEGNRRSIVSIVAGCLNILESLSSAPSNIQLPDNFEMPGSARQPILQTQQELFEESIRGTKSFWSRLTGSLNPLRTETAPVAATSKGDFGDEEQK